MIGILGGTFDPVHEGHIHIATAARARLGLEQIHLMPCATPVHRAPPRADAADRCAMIEAAIANREGLVLNRLEIERAGDSYTVDSLRQLSGLQQDGLALLLGSDAFNAFADWRQPDDILDLANLVVCHRPGARVEAGRFASHLVGSAEAFNARRHGAIIELEVGAPDCSSSWLRKRLASREPVDEWLAPAVINYIIEHGLYRRNHDQSQYA